jgi:hypothetical protein
MRVDTGRTALAWAVTFERAAVLDLALGVDGRVLCLLQTHSMIRGLGRYAVIDGRAIDILLRALLWAGPISVELVGQPRIPLMKFNDVDSLAMLGL